MLDGQAPLFGRKLAEAGITSPSDLTSADDVNLVPTTVKQELRDSEAAHPPFGDYRFTSSDECVRLGSSTGTTGTPALIASANAPRLNGSSRPLALRVPSG